MDERELRDRFGAVGVPPSRLDVESLVRDGRRRVARTRSWRAAAGAAVAIAVLLAVPSVLFRGGGNTTGTTFVASPAPGLSSSPSPSAGPCRATTLAVPKGMKNVTVTAVDPTGRYIVGNGLSGQNFRPILWTAGKPKALSMPGASVQLTGVNAAGVVVGLVEEGRTEYAFRYQNGQYTRLRTPPGNWHVYPVPGINTAGDIVINAEPVGNSGGKDSIVLLWTAGSTTAKKLPLPADANAMTITDDGTLVGALYKDGSAVAGYVWDQQGHGRKLATPAGQTGAAYAARGDWATGGLWPRQTAARWNLRTGEVIEFETPTGADNPPARGGLGPGEMVNAAGWVVAGGFALREDGPVALAVAKGQTAVAVAVSDDGLVVGQANSTAKDRINLGPRAWQC